MTEAVDIALAFGLIAMSAAGYFIGGRFRGMTHAMIPFNEPLSYIVLGLTLAPIFVSDWLPEYAFIDIGSYWYAAYVVAFWGWYIFSYLSNQVDLVYVAVHQIVERTQDIEPIVRYYNKQGQTCWQPQGFFNICKTVFLGIHNPLQMQGSISRTRHVTMRNVFIKIEADTIDLAGMEVNITEIKKGPFTFKVEARKYIPSPNNTDDPYSWFVRAQEYEEVFTHYHELEVKAVESRAAMQMARIQGGADIYATLAGLKPQNEVFEQLGSDFESQVQRSKKRIRKSVESEGAAQGPPQGAPQQGAGE